MRCITFCFWWCCILALVVSQINPVEEAEEEYQIILMIISEFDRLLVIKNLITFVDVQQVNNKSAIAASLQQRLMETFNLPVIVAGTEIGLLSNIINDQNLAVTFFNGMHDPILETVDKALSSLKTMTIIFIYKLEDSLPPTTDHLEAFFSWCRTKLFYNVLVIYTYNNASDVWLYEMKTDVSLIKYTALSLREVGRQEYRKFGDMGEYRSLVALYQRGPTTFAYKTPDGNISLGGHVGLLLNEFMSYVNGTMDILPLSHREYINAIAVGYEGDRCIDIGANLVSDSSIAAYSPIIFGTRTCLILPYEITISLRDYALYFDRNYSLVAFSVFYFIVHSVIKRIANPRLPLGVLLFRNFNLTMGQTLTSKLFHRLGLPEKFIEITNNIYNLLLLSLFCNALTTSLITGLRKPEIVDAEAFLTSGLNIMVYHEQMKSLFDDIPTSLSERVVVVDMKTRDQHVQTLNDSYAYVMQTYNWWILEFIQQRLLHPKLRLGPETLCGAQRYMRFHVRPGLSLSNVFKHFVGQVRESGLVQKWFLLGLYQAEQLGILSQAPFEPPSRHPLPITFFERVFMVYACGMFASLMGFLLEWVYFRWSKNRYNIIIE